MDSFHQTPTKRVQIFIHALIISGTLNFALIATFITFVLKERKDIPFPPAIPHQPLQQISFSNQEVLLHYFSMSFEELVKELYDESLLEHGYRRCDLALSCLSAFHYFDVERALSGFPLEKRQFVFIHSEEREATPIILYPGINADRFKAIRTFVRTELWPLTPFGLYREMCAHDNCAHSLKEALMMTTEVCAIKRRFYQLNVSISDDDILDLLKLSEWTHIEHFTTLPDLLMPCIQKNSKLAAHLLVLLEREYACTYLDNEQMEQLLTLLTETTPEVEAFLEEIAQGFRPTSIRDLTRRSPQKLERTYVVQKGDNLWRISREYNVKVEDLRKVNALQSDNLQPGTQLVLPSKS